MVTFIRFFAKMKARYDYGLLIFILTFSLVSVSGYQERLSTIFIGGAITMMICVFICPVWAGGDLHNLVAINMEKLACFLQDFGKEYLERESGGDSKPKTIWGYRSVLDSKSTEEVLANSAKWEPRHGRFRYRHPWNQYIKIGSSTRECAAYKIEALNTYLNSDLKAPVQVRKIFQESCKKIRTECSCALEELARSIKTMSK